METASRTSFKREGRFSLAMVPVTLASASHEACNPSSPVESFHGLQASQNLTTRIASSIHEYDAHKGVNPCSHTWTVPGSLSVSIISKVVSKLGTSSSTPSLVFLNRKPTRYADPLLTAGCTTFWCLSNIYQKWSKGGNNKPLLSRSQ